MQISGLGRKSLSDICCSLPAAALSSISFLTQCHSFSPVLQRHCSTMPAKQTMYCCSKQEMGPKEHLSLSLCFLVSQAFSRNDDASPRRYVPQEVWCSTAGNSPFSHLRPGIIALRGSGSQAASFIPTTWLGDQQSPPLPHPHTGYTSSSSGKLIKGAMAGDSESDRLHQGMVLD